MNEQDLLVVPTLTLDPVFEEHDQVVKEEEAADQINLTEAEQKMVKDFAEKIDLTNANMVLQYGSGAQRKIAGFSESALNNIKTKDLGQVGDMLTNLVGELRGFNAQEEEKGLKGFFKKTANQISTLKVKYDKAEVNVDKICHLLESHQIQLLKDVAMLDKMYGLNLVYFKELSMYIIAGKEKLAEVRRTDLPQLLERARLSQLPEDTQAAGDMAALCERFEKKIHDLELTRMVSIQMAPQIRMVQNNDTLMAEKIQSTLMNTIPLWKSQMVLALGMAHSGQAIAAQKEVDDLTNALLRQNAQSLKINTVEVAKAGERGIVDIDTLKYTNQMLISTIDEVVKIQTEGRQKRREAEQELGRIEAEIRGKLLDSCR